MSTTENASEASLPSTDFENQALMMNVLNDFKEHVSPQRPLSDFCQNMTDFIDRKNLSMVLTHL